MQPKTCLKADYRLAVLVPMRTRSYGHHPWHGTIQLVQGRGEQCPSRFGGQFKDSRISLATSWFVSTPYIHAAVWRNLEKTMSKAAERKKLTVTEGLRLAAMTHSSICPQDVRTALWCKARCKAQYVKLNVLTARAQQQHRRPSPQRHKEMQRL
eukprot:5382570-Amphidinium_carterae.1